MSINIGTKFPFYWFNITQDTVLTAVPKTRLHGIF